MDRKVMEKSINVFCEFADREYEVEYFSAELFNSLKYVKPLILLLAMLNTLFIIPDYFLIKDLGSFTIITICRSIFLIFALVLFMRLEHMGNPYRISAWISLCELLCFANFIFVFWQYSSPDFLVQVLSMVILILSIFLIPNRWICMVIVTLAGSACFFVVAYIKYAGRLSINIFSAGFVHTALIIILSSVSSYIMYSNKRYNYAINKKLERSSFTDSLTGLINKAKLYEEINMWMKFSSRYKTPLSLILFDIDNFKQINDKHGHLIGDEVIVQVVATVHKMIRETDTLARWGGDEFTIIMPHTNRPQAVEITERIRKSISDEELIPEVELSCSFGVASFTRKVKGVDQFISAADKALYKAKNSGKNVVMY